MENASKALLIAGGLLLVMLILSAFVYMFSTVKDFSKSRDLKRAEQETLDFNAEYEAYDKPQMYGFDVISVKDKAIDYNIREAETEEDKIIVTVDGVEFPQTSDLLNDKTSVFKCTGIDYNEITGRVKSMEFEKLY